MPFCPFRSTAEKEVACSENCALYTDEETCALFNIGQITNEKACAVIHSDLESIEQNLR